MGRLFAMHKDPLLAIKGLHPNLELANWTSLLLCDQAFSKA